jgi:hypothetical protein
VHLHYRSFVETLAALGDLSLLSLDLLWIHVISTAMLRGLDNVRSRVVGPTRKIRTLCYHVDSEMTLVEEEWKDGLI